MNNRVNGVLAVTRSLGDSSMKEFVVGSPYTTETTLGDEDDFLIVACDGVSWFIDFIWRLACLLIAFTHFHQLWDVCEDQTAVDLIRGKDAQKASEILTEHALDVSALYRFATWAVQRGHSGD
jgi:protein phosphatase PTC1